MKTARKLKEKLFFSLQEGIQKAYKTDSEGNILYYTMADGTKIPLEDEDRKEMRYSLPTEMFASISFSNGEIQAQEFGLSLTDFDAIVMTASGEYPLKETSLIWYETEPTYQDAEKTVVNPKSADFTVKAIKPSKNFTKYLIKRVTK